MHCVVHDYTILIVIDINFSDIIDFQFEEMKSLVLWLKLGIKLHF